MKKVFSFIAALALCLQVAHAQTVDISPSSQIAAINGSVGSTVGMDIKLLVPLSAGSEFSSYTSKFDVNASPTSSATGGATLTVTNTTTAIEHVDVFVPAGTLAGTVINVTISVTYTGTAPGVGAGPYTGTATITVSARLAAELLAINAKAAQGKNELTWATASESGNSKFVVERSINGLDFTAVGEVKAVGTSQAVTNYAFMDENVVGSVNYYRLQTVDIAGKTSASKVVAVASKGTLTARVVRSLEGSKLNIASDNEGQATINVVNLNGQIVDSQVVSLTNGVSEHVLNISQSGLFVVQVTKGNATTSTKMFQ